ncbi:MAG: glycosyltransferase, partial [Ignavibacteriota bacterium]
KRHKDGGYVEMPYTLAQDFTPLILMKEKTLKIWIDKLDWIVKNGGMVLINVHPDYIQFKGDSKGIENYPISLYQDFLNYIINNYEGQFWNVLPNEVASFVKDSLKSSTDYDNSDFSKSIVNSKKIFMVVQSYYDGDPRVRRQASALIEAGYSLEVLSLGSKDKPKLGIVDNVIVRRIMTFFPKNNVLIYFLFSSIFFIKAFFILFYSSLKNRYSLIQIHNMPDHLVFVAFFQKIFGTPVLLDIHDLTIEFFREKWSKILFHLIYPILRFFEFLSYKFSSHILTVTQQCVNILNKRGVSKDKITLILNTADESQFPLYKERKFEAFTEGVNIFYHGTIAKRFGLHLVIESLPKVLTKLPGSQLFIYGGGDSDYLIYLTQLVKNLNLEDNVHIPGMIEYDLVDEQIRKMDIAIVPYLDTPYMNLALSTKSFEYISCGIPICASRLEATHTIFSENSISYFDPNNIDDISEKIISLALNPELQRLQVISALEDLEKNSWKEMKKRYLEVINKLTK